MKENKVENMIWILFASIGLLFVVIGIFLCKDILNYENKIETTAIITQISSYRGGNGDRNHEVYVSYFIDENKQEARLNSYSSSFYEGKEIEIYYDKDNPSKVGVKSLDLLCLIFPGIGLIFAAVGGAALIIKWNKKRIGKNLKEKGEVIYADYVETVLNSSYSVNGRHPYYIICEWNNPEDGKKYLFRSQNIWINPENRIQEKNIKTFPVYINMEKKKQYRVDIECLIEDVVDLS